MTIRAPEIRLPALFLGLAALMGATSVTAQAPGAGADRGLPAGARIDTLRLEALAGRRDLSRSVVVLTPPWSGLTELEAELVRRGAAGSIQLIPNGTFYDRLRIVRGPTRYFLPDAIDDPANQSRLPRVTGGPDLISALGLNGDAAPGNTVERARPLDITVDVVLPYTTQERTG